MTRNPTSPTRTSATSTKSPSGSPPAGSTPSATTSETSVFDRPLPCSLEAERALLGSLLIDGAAAGEVIPIFRGSGADVFFQERHRLIYDQILKLYDASQPIDGVVVKEELKRSGRLEAVGGLDYLGQLVNAVPSARRVAHYAAIVRDKHLLRRLVQVTHDVMQEALADQRQTSEMLDDAERMIFEVTEQRITGGATDLYALVQEVFEQIESRDGDGLTGLGTGFLELDQLTCGLQPAELIIVAGRPSMGKTAFGLNVAEHMAITERQPVLFFSLEMSRQQLAQRILCSRARVDAHRVRSGRISPQELEDLQQAADHTRGAPLHVDDNSDLTVLELRARARMAYRKYQFKAIFVDYLQLMRGPKSESRQVEVAEISRGLKALAKELSVPVVALAQLNRGPEDRGGNRPRMSDLRESGAIEQDADVIMLLHREAYYREAPTEEEQNSAELIIAKQRNGPTGEVKLHFNKQWTRFDNPQVGGDDGYRAGVSPF